MPKYEVTHPDGRVLELEGDRPPTEGDLMRIFGTMASKKPEQWQQTNPFNTPFMAGLGGSLYMTGKGIQQKGAQLGEKLGIVSPETVQNITKEGEVARTDLRRLEQEQLGAKVGSFAGDVLPGLAIPGGGKGKLARRILTGMGAGAAQGATRFTGEGESAGTNIATGAAIGGAFPVVTAPIAKVANAIRGRFNKPINVGATQGIPTTLGEDLGNPHLQRVETFMERIPLIGTMGFRKKQYEASVNSAKDYLGKYVAGDEGARGMLEANRKYVNNIYENRVKPLIAEVKTNYVPKETISVANEISNNYPTFWEKFGDQKVLSAVTNFKKGTNTTADILKEKTFNLMDKAYGSGPESLNILYPRSFNDLWELRKGVGDMLGQAKAKMVSGEVNNTQYSMLSKMYSAINDDMDKFATSVGKPEISSAMKTANDAYKQFVVKYNVMDRAMDKAMGQAGTGKTFSPQRFSSELNKILTKEKYSNLFAKAEKQEMAGMANIMTTVKRAGQFMENPPTGNRMIDVAIGGGAIGSFFNPAAATTMGTTAGVTTVAKFLTTTQAGKRFAMAASNLEPDSPAMKVLIEKVIQGARSLAINRATQGGANVSTE